MCEMKIVHSNIKSSTYAFSLAQWCSQACASGKGGSTLNKEIFVSSALAPESHATASTAVGIYDVGLVEDLQFYCHFQATSIHESSGFPGTTHIFKNLGGKKKKQQNLATSPQSFQQEMHVYKMKRGKCESNNKHVVVSGIQKEFDFSSF